MDKTALSQLIQEFGESLALPGLELDEVNACWLTLDDTLVCLEADEALDRLMMYSPVADLPESEQEDVLQTLLKGNLFWRETDGATLAVSGETQKILLQQAVPLSPLTPGALTQHLEAFVMRCEHWSAKLQNIAAGMPETHVDVLVVGQFV